MIGTLLIITKLSSTQQVPMHFAPSEAKGMGFIFSFAIGASIVTICLWILRFGHAWYRTSDMVQSYNSLPSMHFRIMWAPGSLAGLLWSIGNIASMVSVQNLGEGVGYSVTQAAMVSSFFSVNNFMR
jgi:glucose uptake protein GlcU